MRDTEGPGNCGRFHNRRIGREASNDLVALALTQRGCRTPQGTFHGFLIDASMPRRPQR
ncbi:hypothetical protein RM550_26280 [Streptomyces sp. DSM 41527]|uniref:Uncharacterized protein n=1 Tax=Streptomyces mooreae TaxID=3075523 RepID=A0ABU2TE08_9ACTN|nr:hypothetical protein [Streptomyces sp. DSM 41527]MDT0459183.1 hypothetical protein [Streptomyces sp. DSM 41527]